ncbi:MAG: RNA polymerase sigma factor, partial [Acidobacteriota bacterium]|nr:RNA polymerase sigma factor [Acidobacteriota bacterium]
MRFEELLDRHEREIYRFARRVTSNPDDAADVLQDTFLRAFKAFRKLPEDANHRAWLYRIAGRVAIDLARSKKIRAALPIESVSEIAGQDGDPESRIRARRLADAVLVLVQTLPQRQRIALVQRKYEGLPYREIATTLGCSEQTARAHVYQAMTKLRRHLAQSDASHATAA